MATYVYETIPQKPGDQVRRFEARQSMRDEPLTSDPETGLPVKRVIIGGYGIMTKSSRPAPAAMEGCGGGGCGAEECAVPELPRGGQHVCASPFCCRN